MYNDSCLGLCLSLLVRDYVYTIQKGIAKGPQVSGKTLPRLVNSVLQEEPCAGFHVCWA